MERDVNALLHCGKECASSPDQPVQRGVVFPSRARHEVDRVTPGSGEFADRRFALDCWFCRSLTA